MCTLCTAPPPKSSYPACSNAAAAAAAAAAVVRAQGMHPVAVLLSYLTKAPLVPEGTPVVNALNKQRAMLENVFRACIGLVGVACSCGAVQHGVKLTGREASLDGLGHGITRKRVMTWLVKHCQVIPFVQGLQGLLFWILRQNFLH